ncbi:MAG: septum formation family protein [Chloroflexota bacterium]|nr:septum formation family protein [Chloroflexota bacterium]MDE2885542.1 septum formation family protein [Chloroflexota bacterium]
MLRTVAVIGFVIALAVGCGEGNVFELEEGDCFNQEESDEVSDVDIVSCDDPHEYEVYAVLSIAEPLGRPFPGSTRVGDVGFQLCLDRFEEFVARPYPESLLDISILAPTRESWEDLDDREVVCSLFDLENFFMEGSMQGSGR